AVGPAEGRAEHLLELLHLGSHGDVGRQQALERGVDLAGVEGRLVQPHDRILGVEGIAEVGGAIGLDSLEYSGARSVFVRPQTLGHSNETRTGRGIPRLRCYRPCPVARPGHRRRGPAGKSPGRSTAATDSTGFPGSWWSGTGSAGSPAAWRQNGAA